MDARKPAGFCLLDHLSVAWAGKTRIYYHNADLDGLCSGAIAYQHFGEDAEYCGVNYGDPINLNPAFNLILFLDFAPQPAPNPIPNNLFVIDHHKTSIGLPGVINMEHAACELAWDFFNPTKKRPLAVSWIGAADIWRKEPEWMSHVIPFCLALQTEWPDIKDQIWTKLFTDPTIMPYMVDAGQHMLRHTRAANARLYETQAYSTFFAGYTATVLIGGESGSHRFQPNSDQIQIVAQFNGKFWRYSLRSRDDGPDVSDIAKDYGGGGHKHAAGFQHKDLLV